MTYPPGNPSPKSSGLIQLKIAAIILIVLGSFAWLQSAWSVFNRIVFGIPPAPATMSPAGQSGYYIGTNIAVVCAAFSLLLAPVLIFGAAQMLRHRSYGLARICFILA